MYEFIEKFLYDSEIFLATIFVVVVITLALIAVYKIIKHEQKNN